MVGEVMSLSLRVRFGRLGLAALAALVTLGGCDEPRSVEDVAGDAAGDAAGDTGGAASDAAGDAAGDAMIDPEPDATRDPRADAAVADAGSTEPADAATADGGLDPVERPLAPPGAWGPVARISTLDMPATPDAARRAGCLLHGAAVGTKLYSILLLAGGGLGAQVRPGVGGRIELVLLMRARGWAEGVPASALEVVDIEVLPGVQDADLSFRYRADGFAGGDPAAGARTVFAETFVDDGWLDSDLVPFSTPLSLLGSPQVPFVLEQTRITGRIAADGAGWRLESGSIAGYFTLDQLVALITEVQRFCGSDDPPSLCALIGGQVDEPIDALLDLFLGFLDGLEVRVERGGVVACDPAVEGDCNAVGVCLRVEAIPVVVEGVAP